MVSKLLVLTQKNFSNLNQCYIRVLFACNDVFYADDVMIMSTFIFKLQ